MKSEQRFHIVDQAKIQDDGVAQVLEMLRTLSDDQTALLGCGCAFLGATVMLMMSFHANPKNKVDQKGAVSQNSNHIQEQGDQERRRAA